MAGVTGGGGWGASCLRATLWCGIASWGFTQSMRPSRLVRVSTPVRTLSLRAHFVPAALPPSRFSARAALPTAGMASVIGGPAAARPTGPHHVAALLALGLVLAVAGSASPWYKVVTERVPFDLDFLNSTSVELYSMVYDES